MTTQPCITDTYYICSFRFYKHRIFNFFESSYMFFFINNKRIAFLGIAQNLATLGIYDNRIFLRDLFKYNNCHFLKTALYNAIQ